MRANQVSRALAVTLLAAVVHPGAAVGQELSELTMPPNGLNQKAEVSQWIGPVKITISYHSPNVHGGAGGGDRTDHIWGELLKFGFFDEGRRMRRRGGLVPTKARRSPSRTT